MSDDLEIVRRVQRGETQAFALLVERYHRHMLNFIFRLVRDESIVEDIGQEVFLSIYRALPTFDASRSVPFCQREPNNHPPWELNIHPPPPEEGVYGT